MGASLAGNHVNARARVDTNVLPGKLRAPNGPVTPIPVLEERAALHARAFLPFAGFAYENLPLRHC
jgi:hypothetical protein